MKTGKIILISGGARSGKSSFAEKLAQQSDEQVAYLATAQALDEEMAARIKHHASRRPSIWHTFEEPLQPSEVIWENKGKYKTWLLDCVTLYVSNLLFKITATPMFKPIRQDACIDIACQEVVMKEIEKLVETAKKSSITLLAVTNEVGWGLVPPDPLSRIYRDTVGKVNQKLARHAEEVVLVTSGIPLRLKPEPLMVYNIGNS